MTSVYEEKIYPRIPDDDSQAYRLGKIDELFLRDEIHKRDSLTKRFKRIAMASTISDTSVITTLEFASIVTLTTGIGMPISVVLASAGLFLGFPFC